MEKVEAKCWIFIFQIPRGEWMARNFDFYAFSAHVLSRVIPVIGRDCVTVSPYFAGAAGGLTIVVLFSTFFSSFAGGLTMVVFFSTVGGAVLTLASQAAKRSATAVRMRRYFI